MKSHYHSKWGRRSATGHMHGETVPNSDVRHVVRGTYRNVRMLFSRTCPRSEWNLIEELRRNANIGRARGGTVCYRAKRAPLYSRFRAIVEDLVSSEGGGSRPQRVVAFSVDKGYFFFLL